MESSFLYFNLHSHRKPRLAGELTIRNAYTHIPKERIEKYLLSVGVHPWYTDQWTMEATEAFLQTIPEHDSIVAIGECGLDRVNGPSISIQQASFELQCHYAAKYQKPLIIHAVRSYYDLIPYLKKYQIPFIFHGFNGNNDMLNKLLSFNTWFSFGKQLFQPSVEKVFKLIDRGRFFLETDQATHLHIADLYRKAGELMNLSEEEVSDQIWQNANNVFGKRLFIEYQ